MEHTKGKLRVDGNCYVKGEEGEMIATTSHIAGLTFEKQKANAKMLVRRWNAFEKKGLVTTLLTACEKAETALNLCARVFLGTGDTPDPDVMADAITEVRNALAKVKES